ncbi:hypothetical protein AGMMS49936_10460 [Endomicrobiia bacterium]|nr:hypothetical protein AGMMS49936_10460 [Endomicrobiia bacterium]
MDVFGKLGGAVGDFVREKVGVGAGGEAIFGKKEVGGDKAVGDDDGAP